MARRTGRRPGNPDTRASILRAARRAFAERGYDSASIRAIATSAGVDPALVHHYFGTKEQLFIDAMNVPFAPKNVLPEVLAGDRETVGERLVRMFVTVWDSPAGTTAAALMRSAVSHDWSARLLREFISRQVLGRAFRDLGLEGADDPLRATLVASQMMGLAMARYIIKLEPLASASAEQVIAAVAPTVQRYITGDLATLMPAGAPNGAPGNAPNGVPKGRPADQPGS